MINDNKYKDYLKKGILKYIPDFLFPKYKPQVIDEITTEEKIIGYIMGNNVKEIDFNREQDLTNYIKNIKTIDHSETSNIYIEGCDRLNRDTLERIEDEMNLRFNTGDRIKIQNIEVLLRRISILLNRELNKNDLLVVCNDKDRLVEIINSLPEELNCIANAGIIAENLYEDILKETGVSIYIPYRIEKAIKNFHIIINYSEEIYFNVEQIRNQALVLDFSENRALKDIEKFNKNIIYIEDFYFPSKINSNLVDKLISSKFYEGIYGDEVKEFKQIYSAGEHWNLSEYINSKIKKRGRL